MAKSNPHIEHKDSLSNKYKNPKKSILELIAQNKQDKKKNLHVHLGSLKKIPSLIGELEHLELLCLHSNKLQDLPSELKKLINLKSIRLDSNEFKKIPSVLFEMPNLKSIDLSENEINSIPQNLSSFSHLEDLNLRDNNFGTPEEIFDQSPKEIISFLLNLQQGENSSLNEAKMILLGEANVGKTALVEKLTKNTFTGNTGITRGIDIRKWSVNNYKVNIWDFGGQEIMRAMHQFFMTERTLYLLLWNSREDDTNGKIEDWLELIKTYGGNSPVILVISRCDDGNFDPDEHRLLDEYKENIKAIIRTSSKNSIGIENLKIKVLEEIGKLNILKDKIPNKWIQVKKDIEKIEENYINLSEYYKICGNREVNHHQDQISLLKLLKDLGVAFNYGDKENPHTTNILKPEWVTKGIYDIINSNQLFQKHGKVSFDDIENILTKSGDYQSKEKVIIGLMKQFELCFTIEGDDVLIPDLLPEKQPYIGEEFDASLQLQYRYEYIAKSIMPHFIARIHKLSRHIEGENSWYWRSGIIIEKDNNKALVKLNTRKKILYIFIIGELGKRRQLLETIREELSLIHNNIKGKKPEIIVPLPQNPKYSANYKSLLQLERQGEDKIFIQDYGHVKVEDLLNGIETYESRKLTIDNFKDLYTTEQQKIKEGQLINFNRILSQKKDICAELKIKINQKQQQHQDLISKSKTFANARENTYTLKFISFIFILISTTILLAFFFPELRFWLPIISIVITLTTISLNSLGIKYSSKYYHEKCFKFKLTELESVSSYNKNDLISLDKKLKDIELKISKIETQIDCC